MTSLIGAVLAVSERCPSCKTPLQFTLDDGRCLTFTAHNDAFCLGATRERLRALERAVEEQRETYDHRIAEVVRQADELLASHGLPTLTKLAEEKAQRDHVARSHAQSLELTDETKRAWAEMAEMNGLPTKER